MDLKLPRRDENSHKSSYGRVLNIAGSKYYPGAAYLSSISVLKSGCGFVALASEQGVLKSTSCLAPEIVLMPLWRIRREMPNYDVVSIGCGLSTSLKAKTLFRVAISRAQKLDKPTIIDADGLNILASTKNIKLPKKLIITPHPKEAARLLGVHANEILLNPEFWAKKLSEKYSCTTVLKLHKTIVCSSNMRVYVNNTGNSALSKAGSGDVLCGIISSLTAQGMDLFSACKLGVHLHGLTGEIASKELTEYSVTSTELLKYIHLAIRKLS